MRSNGEAQMTQMDATNRHANHRCGGGPEVIEERPGGHSSVPWAVPELTTAIVRGGASRSAT
jgi:hypothetical protein